MKTYFCNNGNWLCSVASGLLFLLMLSPAAHASDVQYLWQSRDQFVALDRQESSPGGAAVLNDHPVELSADRLTAILASIEVRSADNDKPEQLITSQSLEVLVPHMLQGFRRAAPGEDVTFAIIGLYKAMLGLAKSPKVTTGRAFFKEGRLNIIFGLVLQDVNEREDRRLSPFTPGKRNRAASGEWRLIPQAGQDMSLLRGDWVAFGEGWKAPVEQSAAPTAKPGYLQGAPVPPVKRNEEIRGPAERLSTLKELKDKGLISEEEYRGKRLEILNGL